MSYAAGATGRPLFYLTAFDASAQDVAENANATLTVCEMQVPGACDADPQAWTRAPSSAWTLHKPRVRLTSWAVPQDPTCAKVSLTGKLLRVPAEGQQAAARAMFSRHPEMRGWPASHRFSLYELHVEAVRLLDSFGGAKDVSPGDYYADGAQLGSKLGSNLAA